ncbi:MAG: hypothetical protein JWP12_3222, partial [Bacteroidetes bacterium]|nr:hypothetical protein [Bacteroidota bacterium]
YIQAHLEVGKEDDDHEKEANHVADKVMRMPEKEEEEEGKMPESKPLLQKMPESPSLMKMRESPAAPKMPESGVKIQKQTNGSSAGIAAPQNVEQGINSSKGSGSSLSPDLQQELGTKMNADFSDVKVHTDENAVQMNKDVSAKAFTHGNDIYFNSGQYNPASNQGKQLLAHELTHTVQQGNQRSGSIQRTAMAKKEAEEIVLTSHLYFYGTKAESVATTAPQQIQDFWNEAAGTVTIKGKTYKVRFDVTGEYVPGIYKGDKDISNIIKLSNENKGNAKNNFVRVEEFAGGKDKVSHMSGNQAFFATETAGKTTYAHEYGHGLGLGHGSLNPKAKLYNLTDLSGELGKAPSQYDFRGLGQPGIMTTKASLVDPEFQYDPKAKIKSEKLIEGSNSEIEVSSKDATMDPDKRKVLKSDIDLLNLGTLLNDKEESSVPLGASYQWGFTEKDTDNVATQDGSYFKEDDTVEGNNTVADNAINALREKHGFKDTQYIKIFYVTGGLSDQQKWQSKTVELHETVDNSKKAEMKDKYLKKEVRYVYYDVTDGKPILMPLIPVTQKNGMPQGNNWIMGTLPPEKYKGH